MTTFADVLARRLRHDPGQPLLTWYDEGTGERVELSVTTYANWVAKAASLLTDEHDLARGDRLLLELPNHWLGPVFMGAAWLAGVVVCFEPPAQGAEAIDAVVCGPDGVEAWAERADDVLVLACSLRPLGVRFAEALPAGVHDVGTEVWGQPDAFTPWDPPSGTDVALELPSGLLIHDQLWSQAAVEGRSDDDRLLSEVNPASPPGFSSFTEPLERSGSVVLVVGADPARLAAIASSERVTTQSG